MKKSLGKKICVIGIVLIILFVVLNVTLTYFFMIPFSVYLSKQQMKDIALTIENEPSYESDTLLEKIEQAAEDTNTQTTIIDGTGRVICTTRMNYLEKNKIGERTAALFSKYRNQLDKGDFVSSTRDKNAADTNLIKVTLIKKVADDRYAILTRSYRSLQNVTKSALIFDFMAGVVIVLVGSAIMLRLSHQLVMPIRDMTEIAEHIANLEFDTKVKVTTEDEIGQLGKSINKMSVYLEKNLDQLQSDIEKRKRLVRNLSHEIKSPIAVIMAYADRLKAVISRTPDKALQYSEIISNESSRVDTLVREMLEFSKLEQWSEELHLETFETARLFEDLKTHFQEETMGRNIRYIENYDKTEWLRADYILLERAVYNLLRNAGNHGSGENMEIHVTGRRKGEYYEFFVYNSGSFIPESEYDSIWEVFGKVDKVRARGSQGVGVGLSIVREIVEAHQGYYSVRNLGDGVEFCIAVKG